MGCPIYFASEQQKKKPRDPSKVSFKNRVTGS